MKTKNWFEVSKEGLKQLQEGKHKDFVLRELVQNAWDEDGVTYCYINAAQHSGTAFITVEDNAPEGFKDIVHSYMLFAPTYKRSDPERRGRFNIGEKQVLAVCKEAVVSTTKGTIDFTPAGRVHRRIKRDHGSKISITLKMNQQEFDEMLATVKNYLPPVGITFKLNDNVIAHREPYKEVEVALPTEIQIDRRLVRTTRKTKVHIHKAIDKAFLYEMGLPICEIDCIYNVDVQQKVPLSIDRDTVSQSYLQKIFTIVLNEIHEEVTEHHVSDVWVREAMSNKNVSEQAVKSIIKERYGNRVVVANPSDRHSIDEALSHRYRVVYGSELSKNEWANIRKAGAMRSSSDEFPTDFADDAEKYEPDENMKLVAALAKKIAKRCLNKRLRVSFYKWSGCAAQYTHSGTTDVSFLIFNVRALGKRFFNPALSIGVIDLILHELAHEKGYHTEASYHGCLSRMAAQLTLIALEEPEFFKLK